MSKRLLKTAALSLAGAGLFAAALTAPAGQTALAAEKVLHVAMPSGPKSSAPDPRARQNGWLSNRAGVSETLVGLNYNMEMIPRLAVAYANLSPTDWTLTLRDGVTFHDGSPMTAESVKASFETLGEEGHPGHNPRLMKLLDLESIEVVDEHTLVFKTRKPNSAFLWSLSEPSAAVMKEGTEEMPIIGTGPFMFVSAETEKSYETRAYAGYWGGTPKLDSLLISVIPDASVAALALQANDVDLVTNFPEQDFAALKKKGEGQLFSAETARLFFYQLRTAGGPLANKPLRQAISLGLDRQLIVDAALAGVGGTPANGIFPASMSAWYDTSLSLPYDPDKAMAILDEAGIKDTDGDGIRELGGKNLNLKLRSYEGRAALRPTLEISQALLKRIGIGAEISMGEFSANNDALKAGEIQMHLQAWGTAPQGDPDYFPSTLTRTGASYNVSGYSNEELDALLDKGRSNFDDEVRKPFYDRIQAIINEDLPLIPLFHKTQVAVGNGKVKGFRIHPAETYMATVDLDIEQ